MTPGLRHLHAPTAAFEFPNETLSFSEPSVRVCVRVGVFFPFIFNHHLALSLCKHNIYPHTWRPETPVAYEVAMATAGCTQACFHAAGTHAMLHPQGECWESKVRGPEQRGQKLGINCVGSTVMTQYMDVSVL